MSSLNSEQFEKSSTPSGAAAASLPLPPIERISMAPRPLERKLWRRKSRHSLPSKDRRGFAPSWRRQAARRRGALVLLVIAQTALASWSLARTFPFGELTYLQYVILGVFALLFSWISFSFWSNVAGFFSLWRGTKLVDGAALAKAADAPLSARTAVLMPICNEDPRPCFRAIEAMCRSLRDSGAGDQFDFFVLSDSGNPQRQAEEATEWQRTCRAVEGFGRIYYRHRGLNIKRKSGNVADFLRRWSRPYEYMIVLDADSIMTGEALVGLARAMEAAPQVGIIQSTPTIVNGESLFARVQQFASRVYGPLFGASLRFWQLGESYYWGHNAILRIQPFVQHCALARLPGEAPLGGEILSHDFVEAALMGKAGYEIWLALDLPGSYEESPPTLLDELKRDRRWCQGNLQHLRLLFAEGFKTGHRAIFAMGIMAYVSALFWAGFLVLNTIELTTDSLVVPNYFSEQRSLFPTWPQWHPEWAIALASTTALLLFLPKLLSFVLIVKNREARRFGGVVALGASLLFEVVISTLLAPSRMWFHTKYVLLTLLGRPIKWNAQQRAGAGTAWSEAARAHGAATCAASAWVAVVYWFSPAVFVWLLPVAIPLLLSIPLSVYSSRASFGGAARYLGLFAIPEENFPPPVLRDVTDLAERDQAIDARLSSLLHAGNRNDFEFDTSLRTVPTSARSAAEHLESPPLL
jgi:membrane glycosyltransferase